MNYYVLVLPMDLNGTVNRQIYSFADYASAKQSFHTNCGKYFKNETLLMASVCIIDDFCNNLLSDFWEKEQQQPEK